MEREQANGHVWLAVLRALTYLQALVTIVVGSVMFLAFATIMIAAIVRG